MIRLIYIRGANQEKSFREEIDFSTLEQLKNKVRSLIRRNFPELKADPTVSAIMKNKLARVHRNSADNYSVTLFYLVGTDAIENGVDFYVNK